MIALKDPRRTVVNTLTAGLPVLWIVVAYAAFQSSHLASNLVLPAAIVLAAVGPFLGASLAHRAGASGRDVIVLSGLVLATLVLAALLMRTWVVCNEPMAPAQIVVVSLFTALVTGGGYVGCARLARSGFDAASPGSALLTFVAALALVAVCVAVLFFVYLAAIAPALACAAP